MGYHKYLLYYATISTGKVIELYVFDAADVIAKVLEALKLDTRRDEVNISNISIFLYKVLFFS